MDLCKLHIFFAWCMKKIDTEIFTLCKCYSFCSTHSTSDNLYRWTYPPLNLEVVLAKSTCISKNVKKQSWGNKQISSFLHYANVVFQKDQIFSILVKWKEISHFLLEKKVWSVSQWVMNNEEVIYSVWQHIGRLKVLDSQMVFQQLRFGF